MKRESARRRERESASKRERARAGITPDLLGLMSVTPADTFANVERARAIRV
jgi:hypothetical protein